MKSLIVIVLFLLGGIGLQAQTSYHFKNFRSGKDFNGSFLFGVQQDHRGAYWIITSGFGIVIFDGHEFSNLLHDNTDPTSLSSNFPTRIIKDLDGNLWIGSHNGLNLYNAQNDEFERFAEKPGRIDGLAMDAEGRVWFESQGISVLEQQDSGYVEVDHYFPGERPSDLINADVAAIEMDADGAMWVATTKGLHKYNQTANIFEKYLFPGAAPIESIFIDASGLIWVATYGDGLWTFNPENETFDNFGAEIGYDKPVNSNIHKIRKVFVDSQERFWVATDGGGVYLLHKESKQAHLILHDPLDEYSLVSNSVLSIFEDADFNIWFCTTDGISVYNSRFNQLFPKDFIHAVNGPLSNRWVGNVSYDSRNKQIWMSVDSYGVEVYNEESNVLFKLRHSEDDTNSLASDKVWSLYMDDLHRWWVGHYGAGVTIFDPSDSTYKRFPPGKGMITGQNVHDINGDRFGNVWVGSNLGIDRIKEGNHLAFYGLGDIRSIKVRRNGEVWAGGNSGLWRFNDRKEEFEKIHDAKGFQLIEDQELVLWIATLESGLKKYDDSRDSIISYDAISKFTGDELHGLLEDSKRNLWIGAASGLYRLDQSRQEIEYISSIPWTENITFRPRFQDSEGYIYVSGKWGMLKFNPEILPAFPSPNSPVINRLDLFNEPVATGSDVLPRAIEFMEKLTFTSDQNMITLGFTSVQALYADELRFEYKLTGFDEAWRPARLIRNATYTNLDPGNYTFEVRVINPNNREAPERATIGIVILPPWYSTWWAISLYILIALGLIWLILRTYIRHERFKTQIEFDEREINQAREIDQIKTTFFSNISHELRTPLTLIIGPLRQFYDKYNAGEDRQTLSIMMRNSKRLLHMVNQLLDLNKLSEKKLTLHAAPVDLVQLSREIFTSFQSQAITYRINYQFSSDNEAVQVYLDKDKYAAVLMNLLSNAFKYATHIVKLEILTGVVDVEMDRGQGVAEVKVTDDGIGIPAENIDRVFERFYQIDSGMTRKHQGSGVGLALARAYAEMHHGRLWVESTEGEGAIFRFRLPLGNAHLSDEQVIEAAPIADAVESEWIPQITYSSKNLKTAPVDLPLLLVVDDHPDMLTYIQEVMGAAYRIEVATSGKRAMELAFELIPDLIISDVMMPEMDGFEFCRRIKTEQTTCHIPVVLLTARVDEKGKLEGLQTGADDYVTKPFSPAELRTRVNNLIELRKLLQQRSAKKWMLDESNLPVSSLDQSFLDRAKSVMEEYLSDPTFSVELFSERLAMSRSQLHRKFKALINQSPGDYVRSFRLKHARKMLELNQHNVTQVAYDCGFSSPSNFTEAFKRQYGIPPSAVQNSDSFPKHA